MFAVGLIVIIIGLILSVALHELGHLLPAKKFGAIVPEYWVGFGPTIWQTKRGSTVYGIKAILLGGYVRIVGMFPPFSAKAKTLKPNGQPTLAEQARMQSAEDIQQARSAGAVGKPFYQLGTGQKLVIMLGGPVMNLLIAVVMTAIVIMGIGWAGPSNRIEEIAPAEGGTQSPAMQAGIMAGDEIIEWNGVPTGTWTEVVDQIQVTPEGGADVVVLREGETTTLRVIPEVRADGSQFVGVVSALERQRGGPGEVAGTMWQQFYMTGAAIIALPVNLFELTKSLFTGEERDPTGVVSIVGVARLAGEITSPSAFTSEAEAGSPNSGQVFSLSFVDRVSLMLSLLAALNMALFVFNLIPLPPLDGGHVAGALWAGGRNQVAKLRGKPKPAPADTARMVPLTYGVFGALMVMTVILVVADIVKPLSFS